MTNRIAHYFSNGGAMPSLDVLSTIEFPLHARRATDGQLGANADQAAYFEGYALGVRQTEERLRGLHWLTLVVGVILGAFWSPIVCWLTSA